MPGMTHRWESQSVRTCTQVIMNAMVYSAVIVVQMMKTAQDSYETVCQRQVKPDNGFKKFISNILHYEYDILYCL